jgi:hypothetical protein
MINDIQIPAVSALTSVDAIAIRSIVNALLNEIVKLQKDVASLKEQQTQRKNYYRENR